VNYVNQNYVLHNFKPIDENLDKIMFDEQMYVKVNIEFFFRILKNIGKLGS